MFNKNIFIKIFNVKQIQKLLYNSAVEPLAFGLCLEGPESVADNNNEKRTAVVKYDVSTNETEPYALILVNCSFLGSKILAEPFLYIFYKEMVIISSEISFSRGELHNIKLINKDFV